MNERIQKVKTHLDENKKVYIAAVVGIAIGVVSTLVIRGAVKPSAAIEIATKIQGNDNTVNNVVQVIIPALGDPGNIVQCVETGTIYASQGQAAREAGSTAARISRHLNGTLADINGQHYKILGKAGEAFAS